MNGLKSGFLAVVLALASASSAAATYYVSEAYGDDGNNGTTWATPLKSLTPFTGGTPTKSLAGNTVIVSNGTYTISKPLYMHNLSVVKSLSGNPDDVIIDGQGQTPVFYMAYAAGNDMGSIYGLTVQGGYLETANPPSEVFADGKARDYAGGAGVYIGNDNRNVVSNCVIRDCHVLVNTTVTRYGGGIYCNQGKLYDVVISNCTISADANKAKALGGGVYLSNCQVPDGLFVTNCHSKITSGTETDCRGGGVFFGSTTAGKAKRIRISGCSAAYRGGGACFSAAGTYRNYYVENSSSSQGGGVCLEAASTVLAVSTVTNCTATFGGGIYLVQNSAVITNCLIVANKATATGTGGGGGIYCENGRSGVTFVDSVIRGNSSAGKGGAFQFGEYRFNSPSIIRCVIENNTAAGIGALTSGSSCYNSKLWDCIVTGNSGRFLLYHYANPGEYTAVFDVKEWWIRNCYIARNTSSADLIALQNVPSRQTYSVIDHCTIVDNNKDIYQPVMSANAGAGTTSFSTNNHFSACVVYGNGYGGTKNFETQYTPDQFPNVKYCYTTGVPMAAQNNYNPSKLLPADQFADWLNGDWRLNRRGALLDQDTTAVCVCDWMKEPGVTDLGDGTYTLETVDDYGVHVVFNNTKNRWLGSFPDIGCFEYRHKTGFVLFLR